MELKDLPTPIEETSYDGLPQIRCAVEKCYHVVAYGKGFDSSEMRLKSFDRHLEQHVPPKIPDLRSLSITYHGTCTSCGCSFSMDDYGGDYDYIWCEQCDASWNLDGSYGRLDREY